MTHPQNPYPGQPVPRAMPAPAPMPSPVPMPAPGAPSPGLVAQGHAPMPGYAPGQMAVPQAAFPPAQPPATGQQRGPLLPGGMAPAHPQAAHGHPQTHPHAHSQAGHPGQPLMPPSAAYAAPPCAPMQGGVAPTAPLPNTAQQSLHEPMREGGERALPQISIHAFCDRNETASCINQMTRDWRMRRTNTKIYMGGLQAAIDYYHKENTPGLIMIESGMRGGELFNQLEQLASVCDEGTKVVMIGAANDIRLYRQLIEKGVSDYIVPPLHPLNVIRSLGEIYADPDKPFTGRTVAFFGSKGGVGSSTLAHNIAWTLAERMMQETALLDLDSSWGTTALDFAYDSASGLEEALAEPDRLDDALMDRIMVRHTERLSLLPASSSLNVTPKSDAESYNAVIDAVRSISPLSILDLPHIWSDWTTSILTTVDDVVITTVPDLANLRNTKNLIDFLKAQRPHDVDPILVLNQTGKCSKGDEIPVENFAGTVGLDPALVIGFDPDTFNRACNEGKMLSEMKTTEELTPGLEYLARRVRTGHFDSAPLVTGSKGRKSKDDKGADAGGSKSLFASLIRRKG